MQIKRGINKLKSNLSKKGFTVSSTIIIGIFTNPDTAFADCSLNSDIISSASTSSESLKVYSSGSDSKAFRAYNESNTVTTHSMPTILTILLLTTASLLTYLFINKNEPSTNPPISQSVTPTLIDKFETVIWNHNKNNLSKLQASTKAKIHFIHPISKKQYIGTTKEKAYIPLPKNIPSTPIKITISVKNPGTLGSIIIDGIKIPPFDKWFFNEAKIQSAVNSKMIIYLLNKVKFIKINNNISSITSYNFDLKGHQACLVLFNVQLYEIKMESMNEKEIKQITKEISPYKNKQLKHYPAQTLPQ